MRFDLSDEEWALLEPLMPKSRKSARADDRRIMNAIFYVLRTGMPWRDLPARFGYWKSVHQRFSRWAKSGVFDRIFRLLASDADNEYMMIDATIVRAHQHSAGAQKKAVTKRSADRAAD